MIAIDNHDVTLDLPSSPTKFRSTIVRPYFRDKYEDDVDKDKASRSINSQNQPSDSSTTGEADNKEVILDEIIVNTDPPLVRRGRP